MTVLSISQRLKIALGGFLAFTGFVILVIAISLATDSANLSFISEGVNGIIALSVAATLEIVGGLILFLGSKKITISFAGNEKKTDKNTH
jgi:hypothetical protein